MAKQKKEERYSFLEPGEMPRANASLWFSGGSFGIFLFTILLTWFLDGKAPLALGALGLVGALMALYAFIIGTYALVKHQARQRLCILAASCSGLMTILWLTVFLNGIAV